MAADERSRPWLWLSAVAGVLSPVVLATLTTFVAAQRPEYSHIKDAISELGAIGRPHATLMNLAGVIPAGLLTSLAAPALYRAFGRGRIARAGEIVLVLAGACLAGTALFAWKGAPNDLSSANNRLHLAFALSGFLCLAIAPLLFGLRARRNVQDRARFAFSIATALAVFLFGFVLPRPPYLGIFQRGALTVFFVWLIASCVQSLRQSKADSTR